MSKPRFNNILELDFFEYTIPAPKININTGAAGGPPRAFTIVPPKEYITISF